MFKFLIFCLISYFGYRMIKGMVRNKMEETLQNLFPNRNQAEPPSKPATPLLQCSQCGAWVATSEAITKGNKSYCSPRCLGQG